MLFSHFKISKIDFSFVGLHRLILRSLSYFALKIVNKYTIHDFISMAYVQTGLNPVDIFGFGAILKSYSKKNDKAY